MTISRSPNRRGEGGVSARGIRALVLLILFPPVGLLYIWRALVFPLRGRLFMTFVALVEMTLLFVWGFFGLITWSNMPGTVRPQPGLSVAVTAAPKANTMSALSNMEEIISGETVAPEDTSASEGD